MRKQIKTKESPYILRCRVLFFLISILLISIPSRAQSTFRLTLKDSKGTAAQNILVKMVICNKALQEQTDKEGCATFHIVSEDTCKEAKIIVESKLYEKIDTLLNISKGQTQITLTPKTQQLKQVEVVAYRRIAKTTAEKTVYTLDTSGFLKTTKANKALEFLPGVEAIDNIYTIIGKSHQAKIKINGIPASPDELKTIEVKDIDKVEVRDLSKDDNDHFSGEINIIKKRHTEKKIYGFLSAWTGLLHPQYGTLNTLNYQSKYWDIMMLVNLVTSDQKSEDKVYRKYENQSEQVLSTNRMIKAKQELEIFKASYFPTKKFNLTLKLEHSKNPGRYTENVNDFDGSNYQRKYDEKIHQYDSYVNASYKFNDKNRLLMKGSFLYYKYTNDYADTPQLNYKSAMREYSSEIVSENDDIKFLGMNDITTGFKNIFRQNITHTLGTLSYSMQQLYFTDYHSYNNAFSSYLILKGETDNQGPKRTYSFQPSLRLNYNLGKAGSLAANYERRILRPSVDYLNTDTLYISAYQHSVGNKNLKAQHSDAFSLTYSKQIGKGYLTTAANYEYAANIIDQIYNNKSNFDVTTYENIGTSNYASLSANYMQRFCKNRMNLSLSLSGDYRNYDIKSEFKSQALIIPTKGFGYSTTLNMSYLSTKGWMYSLTGTFRPRTLSLSSIYHKNPSVYLTVQKSFFKDKLDLELDFLKSLVYFWNTHTEYQFRNLQQQSERKTHVNNITISATWNFGKRFAKRKVAENITNDDITLKKQE